MLNRIQRLMTRSKISTSSTKMVFFVPIRKTRWPPCSLIGWDIFDFSSETAERNSIKLDRKQELNVLYQVCIFRADQLTKMAALADSLKRWHIVLRCIICGPLGLLFCQFYPLLLPPVPLLRPSSPSSPSSRPFTSPSHPSFLTSLLPCPPLKYQDTLHETVPSTSSIRL